MQRNTKGNGFAGAVVMTVLTVGVMLLLAWATLTGYFGAFPAGPFVTAFVLFLALLFITIAVGAVKALYQRWQEIEKGELDEARKY